MEEGLFEGAKLNITLSNESDIADSQNIIYFCRQETSQMGPAAHPPRQTDLVTDNGTATPPQKLVAEARALHR